MQIDLFLIYGIQGDSLFSFSLNLVMDKKTFLMKNKYKIIIPDKICDYKK